MRVVPVADPLAELARLRRPTGPWLHLLDGAPSDARQLGWMLGQDGVVVRLLRGHCLRTGYGLFDETAAALQLPGDPVEDWSALATLLTDMGWLPGAGHALVVTRATLLLAADPLAELSRFVAAVREVARGRAEEGEPAPFHVVLQDDAVGLAVLRARLDAVGARYDELSGWDAEEPAVAVAASRRSAYSAGDPRPDDVDRAVTAALSGSDGVLEVRRGWEEFRGPSNDPVRVYAPVLAGIGDRAVDIAAAVAAAAAGRAAACIVLPLPVDTAARDQRQHAVAAASTVVRPEPEIASTGQPCPPAAGSYPAAAARSAAGHPVPAPAAQVSRGTHPAPSTDPAPSTTTAAPATVTAPIPAGPAAAEIAPSTVDVPADDPAATFELVAANLEWEFAGGSGRADPVDELLVRDVAGSPRSVALFRSWVRDPVGGWVRVVMAYVGFASIADVATERSRVVEALQRAGAKKCCVEIVGRSDVGDVHRWLEERSVPLRLPGEPAGPAAAVSNLAETTPDAHAAPTLPPETLPPDARFTPGPGREGPVSARLVEWAADRPGVIGVVTAWTELDGRRVLVVGVVVEGDADQQAVRAEAGAVVGSDPPCVVEPFAPAAGMAPSQLRLYRGSTRLWARRVERPAGAGRLDTGYRARTSGVDTVLDPVTPVTDDQLATGFTIVGVDLSTSLEQGPAEPDECDRAVADWVRAQPHALSLLGALTRGGRETVSRVYTVLVDDAAADAAAAAIRRGVAEVVASTGADRCAVEVFCPFQRLSVFHVRLYGGSVGLWKAERRPAAAGPEPGPDPATTQPDP